jgi:hypothetical protein
MVSEPLFFKLRSHIYFLLGKHWHAPRSAFRPKAGNSTFEKRSKERRAMATVKAREKEMKEGKEMEKQVCEAL